MFNVAVDEIHIYTGDVLALMCHLEDIAFNPPHVLQINYADECENDAARIAAASSHARQIVRQE